MKLAAPARYGLASKAPTLRDSLFILDAIHTLDGGQRPETVITDTASYSDIVFGLFAICGYQCLPSAQADGTRPSATRPARTASPRACTADCGRTITVISLIRSSSSKCSRSMP